MKIFIFVIGVLVAVAGYGNATSADHDIETATSGSRSGIAQAVPTPKTTAAKPGIMATLKKSAGKYPYDIKLIENKEISARLRKLMGREFTDLKQNWNVERPMVIHSNIVEAYGCEKHNCGDNHYLMYVDLINNNINVFHFNEEGKKTYFEKGEIELPKAFADALATEQ